jgi:hypothetical protein
MIAPTVFSMIWFSVFGAAGIQADNQTNGAISSATGTSEALGLFAYLQQNPLFLLTSISMIFLVWIFFVAGADAGTIVLGSMSAGSVLNPKRLIKLTCAATRPENLSARRCRTPATAGQHFSTPLAAACQQVNFLFADLLAEREAHEPHARRFISMRRGSGAAAAPPRTMISSRPFSKSALTSFSCMPAGKVQLRLKTP